MVSFDFFWQHNYSLLGSGALNVQQQLFENVTRVRPRALVLLISEIWFLNSGVCLCFLLLAGRLLCLCVYGLKMVAASAVMSASWHVVGGPLVHGRGFAEDKGFMRGGYV